MSRIVVRSLAALRAPVALVALCGATVLAQKLPPIRPLGAVEHTSTELFGAVSSVRALSGGRVLVNDISGRRVVLFDPALSTFTVVADTTSATANAYSSRAGGLFAYRGDSTLFVDPTSLSMLVIGPDGAVVRVMSVPRPDAAGALIGGPGGTPGFDRMGRLVYRAPPQFRFGPPPTNGGPPQMPAIPDSMALVAVDLPTRKLDTLGWVKTQKVNMNMSQDANGRVTVTNIINPMQIIDDWAVMADGSVVIVRGRDYHLDWVGSDGKIVSAPKLPFAWRKLDDSTKIAFLDSTKTAMEKLREAQNAARLAGGTMPPMQGPPDGGGAGGGMVVMSFGGPPGGGGGGPRPAGGGGGAVGGAGGATPLAPLVFVSPSELPDYAPAFNGGSARSDTDGNLWIRTSNVINGGSVYDVINNKGELIDRVQVPPGRVISGFGAGGVVYMGYRDGTLGVRLEQARRR